MLKKYGNTFILFFMVRLPLCSKFIEPEHPEVIIFCAYDSPEEPI